MVRIVRRAPNVVFHNVKITIPALSAKKAYEQLSKALKTIPDVSFDSDTYTCEGDDIPRSTTELYLGG